MLIFSPPLLYRNPGITTAIKNAINAILDTEENEPGGAVAELFIAGICPFTSFENHAGLFLLALDSELSFSSSLPKISSNVVFPPGAPSVLIGGVELFVALWEWEGSTERFRSSSPCSLKTDRL
jgi:hypothetical protein